MSVYRNIFSILLTVMSFTAISQIPIDVDLKDWNYRGEKAPYTIIVISSESESRDTLFDSNLYQTRLHYQIPMDDSLVRIQVNIDQSKKKSLRFDIPLKGNEDSILVEMTPSLQKRWNRSYIYIHRFYPNNIPLIINQHSEFSIGDHPMFIMINRSDNSISAYESGGGFGGDLIRADGAYLYGKNNMPRSRILGFWNHPLLPADTTFLTFGIFDPYSFEMSGDHTLRLHYTITNTAVDSTIMMKRNEWDIKWLDVYSIDYKFNVK